MGENTLGELLNTERRGFEMNVHAANSENLAIMETGGSLKLTPQTGRCKIAKQALETHYITLAVPQFKKKKHNAT